MESMQTDNADRALVSEPSALKSRKKATVSNSAKKTSKKWMS
jgi:hypothetical protein